MSGSSSKSSSTCSSPRSYSSYGSSSAGCSTASVTSSSTGSCAESLQKVGTKGIVLLGIPNGTTRRALADIFDKYGPVVNVQILPPVIIQCGQVTRAVVDFATCKGAAAALQVCGAEGTTAVAAATSKTTGCGEEVEMEGAWDLGPRMSFNGVQVAVVPKTQEWNAKLEAGAVVIKREKGAGKAGATTLSIDSTYTNTSSTSNVIDDPFTTAAATTSHNSKKLAQAKAVTDSTPKFSEDPTAQESWRGVYLRGVPANTTEQDLYNIFSCCGKITNIRIPQSKLYATNAAYVDFETFEATAEALRLFGAAEGAAPKAEAGEGGKGAAAPSKRGKSARQKKGDYHRNQLAEHQKDGMVPRLVIRGVGCQYFPRCRERYVQG